MAKVAKVARVDAVWDWAVSSEPGALVLGGSAEDGTVVRLAFDRGDVAALYAALELSLGRITAEAAQS